MVTGPAAATAAGQGRGQRRADPPGAATMPRLLLFLLLLGHAIAVSNVIPGLAGGDWELAGGDQELLAGGDKELATGDQELLAGGDQELAGGDQDLAAGDQVLLAAGDRELAGGDPELTTGYRALLAELAGLAEPVQPGALGVPCRTLLPSALPGFSRLPPLPRGLARAALTLALHRAGCAPQAAAEALELVRELGTPRATAVLRGLARLPGTPGPRPLALLLLGLARPGGSACVDAARLRTLGPRPTPLSGRGLQELAGVRLCRGAVRRRREDEDACSPAGEREAHRVMEWVPGVSIFYNLGTSVYFAFQGCEATASTRALEAAEGLGYAGLAAIAGSVGGPVAAGVQLGLQPGIKAGVRALIGYFTSAGEPSPVPTAHSGPVVIV